MSSDFQIVAPGHDSDVATMRLDSFWARSAAVEPIFNVETMPAHLARAKIAEAVFALASYGSQSSGACRWLLQIRQIGVWESSEDPGLIACADRWIGLSTVELCRERRVLRTTSGCDLTAHCGLFFLFALFGWDWVLAAETGDAAIVSTHDARLTVLPAGLVD